MSLRYIYYSSFLSGRRKACSGYGTAWPAKTPVHRSSSTATWPLTTTKGMPVGY